jgi:hypothetical protein
VCRLAQIQNLYADCWGSAATTTDCDDFYNDPTNTPCIHCMITQSTAPSWGAIVLFPGTNAFANLGGCLALVTGDSGPGSCAQVVETLQQCEVSSCRVGCPTEDTAEAGAVIVQCRTQSETTTCMGQDQAAVPCENASPNDACGFADFEADFIGVGQVMCAATVDGGADATPE